MHALRADLQLDHIPFRTDDGRVERLVAVMLRNGDVVLEVLRYRRILLRNEAVNRKAVRNAFGIDDDADTVKIVNVLEALVLVAHLVVDRKQVLGPSLQLDGGIPAFRDHP